MASKMAHNFSRSALPLPELAATCCGESHKAGLYCLLKETLLNKHVIVYYYVLADKEEQPKKKERKDKCW